MNAKRLSKMIKNKPVQPSELLVNWTSFLCEFGDKFTAIQPMATKLSFVEYYLIDIFATVAVLLISFVFIAKFFIGLIRKYFCSVKKEKKN